MTQHPSPWWRSHLAIALWVSALAATLWLAVLVPSGFGIQEMIAFVPPAAALAVFMRWVSFALSPSRWSWDDGMRAALVGAALLPPFLTLLVVLVGLERPPQLLVLFVIGAWIALGAGLLAAVVRAAWATYRRASPSAVRRPSLRAKRT
jgi:hypothetical protein